MGQCDWSLASDAMRAYHDLEWGTPVHDDRQMFEHLSLECLQCGLSWGLMMKKREVFRRCFADFDYDRVAGFSERDVERILATEGMLHSERKIRAIIGNARAYQRVREEFGTFCRYLWAFTDGKVLLYEGHAEGAVPVSNGLSARIAKDLKRRGFTYVGPITIYSHLQACGIINDHAVDCSRYAQINASHPTVRMPADREVF